MSKTAPSSSPATPNSGSPAPDNRNRVYGVLAALFGGLAGLFPVGAGLAFFLDPLFRRKKAAAEGAAKGPLIRVARVETIPADGSPIQVPVIADLQDAWSLEPNQPIGSVYLRRNGAQVECLNAICPHAGCVVGFTAGAKDFKCPCHTSSFQLTGERIMPSPSPRDMDRLTIDETKLKDGEVWIEFVNYYPAKETQEPKP